MSNDSQLYGVQKEDITHSELLKIKENCAFGGDIQYVEQKYDLIM